MKEKDYYQKVIKRIHAAAGTRTFRAEQPSYPDVTLSIEVFRERVVDWLAWSFQTYR